MTTWKRGDIVRTKCRLMFGKVVVPKGTKIRIQECVAFSAESDAYEGNALLETGLELCYPLWPDELEEVT